MAAVQELGQAARDVVRQVGPAVVGIGDGWGQGSGVVVAEGQVLTNAHNLRGEGTTVTFSDGRQGTGRALGVDVDGDLALLGVDTGGVAPAEWSEGEAALGDVVFALANPGGHGLRATLGLISAVGRSFRGPRGRRIAGSLEHTAPLPRGSSGGPLVDASGRVLGINTHRLGEGFYLAVPADVDLRARLESLRRGEVPTPLHLGVALAPGRAARQLRRAVGLPDRDGLLVRAVQDDSPAARAGVRTGDLVVAAGGQAVATVDDLHGVLDAVAPGGSLPLSLVRGSEELELVVSFAADATRAEGSA